jgi:hypothetical protein
LPFFRRKWKASTRGTSENRLSVHLVKNFAARELNGVSTRRIAGLSRRKETASVSPFRLLIISGGT